MRCACASVILCGPDPWSLTRAAVHGREHLQRCRSANHGHKFNARYESPCERVEDIIYVKFA
jgi:hypothetical protein